MSFRDGCPAGPLARRHGDDLAPVRMSAWSATVIALGFSMNRLESGLLGPIQGWMVDRFGPRAVMRVGAVVAEVGLQRFLGRKVEAELPSGGR